MFRESREATFVRGERELRAGRILKRRIGTEQYYLFTDGGKRDPYNARFELDEFRTLVQEQMSQPVCIGTAAAARRWWMYRDAFYVEDEGLSSDDVEALALQLHRKRERRLSHARALRDSKDLAATRRESIPEDVKAEVWRRDQGRCSNCGSRDRLEFDHVIPLAMGGSNTVRNLQLLCESCNRSKGMNL
jgi:5-methylcytosine-specific restriction endonuclease McrA